MGKTKRGYEIRPGANLKNAGLEDANLTGAKLSGANLTGAYLERANLTDANLTGANLTDAHLDGANLTRADLTGANLGDWGDLSCTKLTGTNLTGVDLTRINLFRSPKIDLSTANLTGTNLTAVDLRRKFKLRGANLTGANLRDADLRGVDLTGANLSGANLRDADLKGVDLTGANLTNANLSGALLRKANLTGAKLDGVNLKLTILDEVDLSVVDLDDADLSAAHSSVLNGILGHTAREDLSVKNLIEVSLGHAVGSETTRGRFCLTCPYEGDVDEEFCPDCFVVLDGNTRIQQPLSRVKYARHKTYSDSPNPNKSFSYSWEEDTTPVPYMAEEGSTYPRNVAGREVRKLTRTLNRLTKDLDYMVRVSRYHTWRGTDVRLKLDDCCYLCGRLTDPTSSHGMYPTVDHVIPQAAVEDSRQVPASVVYSTSNLRSAHMLCNTRKNDKNLGDLELPYDPPQDWDATDIAERWALYDLIIAIQDRLRELRGYVPQKTWDSVVVAYRGREDQQHKMAVLKLPEKLPIVGS